LTNGESRTPYQILFPSGDAISPQVAMQSFSESN
jgi:hypothetical protein